VSPIRIIVRMPAPDCFLGYREGSLEVAADGAAPGPEGGGPGPAAPAPQTLLARCVLSATGYIAGVGTIVVFGVSVCSSVSTSMSSATSRVTSGSATVPLMIWLGIGAGMATVWGASGLPSIMIYDRS